MRSASSKLAQEIVEQLGWHRVMIRPDVCNANKSLDELLCFWAQECGTNSLLNPLEVGNTRWDWDLLYDCADNEEEPTTCVFWFKRPDDAVLCKLIWGIV